LKEGFFKQTDADQRVSKLKETSQYKSLNLEDKKDAEKKARYNYGGSRGFLQGIMKYGFVETVWGKTNPKYTLDALPGVSTGSLENLKSLGINNIEDLSKKRNSLQSLKYVDKAGRKMPIFKGQDVKEVEVILDDIIKNK